MIGLFKTRDYGVSVARLWVMRIPYALTGVLFGIPTWTTLLSGERSFEALPGVAYAFWGALCVLAIIGIRFPLLMLPVLLIQFLYKLNWLIFVGYPLAAAGPLDDYSASMMDAMRIGVVIDVVAIPWLFVARRYLFDIFRHADP